MQAVTPISQMPKPMLRASLGDGLVQGSARLDVLEGGVDHLGCGTMQVKPGVRACILEALCPLPHLRPQVYDACPIATARGSRGPHRGGLLEGIRSCDQRTMQRLSWRSSRHSGEALCEGPR